MFRKKPKKVEGAEIPKRVKLLGYAGPHQSWSSDEARSMTASLSCAFAEKLSAVIEYEDELWTILENSSDFHRLKRVRLQHQLDDKLSETAALSKQIMGLRP